METLRSQSQKGAARHKGSGAPAAAHNTWASQGAGGGQTPVAPGIELGPSRGVHSEGHAPGKLAG